LKTSPLAHSPKGVGKASAARSRGSNHVGMRQFNERVVLQALRLHGSLPKADLARLTKLSGQAVSLIINRLLEDELVIKQERLRGNIGQPSIPIALNPDGAYSVGITIGRRATEVLLIDFVGTVRLRFELLYAFPNPEQVFAEIASKLKVIEVYLGKKAAKRLSGVGIAAPLGLDGWQQLLGVSQKHLKPWGAINIRERLQDLTDLPVEFAKDTAAACIAELVAGHGRRIENFLYLFVDTFIGGGLVLDSRLHAGLNGNAGAIGSMPLRTPRTLPDADKMPPQLLSEASLFNLEELFRLANLDVKAARDERALQKPWLVHTEVWLTDASYAIAFAVQSTACLLDVEDVVVDGVMSRDLVQALIAAIQASLDSYSWEGVHRPEILPGTVGADARAIGGALLPLYANFAPARSSFLKAG
jgi:predicted NBD/HSP70 family sugar kinase